MARRFPKPAAALAIVLCALVWTAQADDAPARQSVRAASASLLGGVNIGSVTPTLAVSEVDRAMAAARALHAKLVRLEVPWSAMEPLGPNQIDPRTLAAADRVAADAAVDGVRIVLMVENTPCWASSAPSSLLRRCVPGRASRANAWPPREAGAFAAFSAFLASRYGAQLAAIEVWNEPDQVNEAYFAGPSKPARYAALLRAAYPAIKQADPDVAVLAGSLVGSNGAFLRALYAAGIKGYYDGLAVHFYNLTLASLRSIHEVQIANGDATPLWLDEFGWTSCWPGRKIEQEQACVTPQAQATNITNAFHALAAAPYVAAAVIYKLRDSEAEDFGVLSAGGARKPAFAALARVLSSPLGGLSRVTLRLRRHGAAVIASGSGPVGDFIQLEAFQGSTLRFRALFTLDRFNRYSLVLPAALGTSGLRVRVYDYWSGLSTDAQASI
jgi:polysaccharide biosynthesis protein PslG